MLSLETLFVANQAARRGVLPAEALRELLGRLAKHPERVQLVRVLHEHKGVPLADARALHEQAQRYLRERWEQGYLALLRGARLVPEASLGPLLAAQQAASLTWSLGDRLVRDGLLPQQHHHALCARAAQQLAEHERRVVDENVQRQFEPVLGPPPSRPIHHRDSSRLQAVAPPAPEPEADLGGATIKLSPDMAAGLAGDPDFGGGASAGEGTMVVPLGGPAPGPSGIGGAAGALPDAELTLQLDASKLDLRPPAPEGTAVMALGADPGAAVAAPGAAATSGAALMSGQVVGGSYTLIREVGRGAMGVVFMAQAAGRDAAVAVKVVQGPATAEVRGRFRREILVSQRLEHPNVIAALDHGELADGSSYMVMEFLEGEPLSDLVAREGAQSVERSLDLYAQLLDGLSAVHQRGIVHRDLKPENLQLLQREGRDHVKIVDFGISRFLDQEEVQAEQEEQIFMTVKGNLSGTPQYVAPEAVMDPDEVTTGHDVYACGVILYEFLTGQLPFPPARSLRDMLSDTVNSRPRDMAETHPAGAPYPPPLERMVRRLLEKDPELRPRDAAAARALLDETRAELGGAPATAKVAADAGEGSFTARFLRGITSLFRKRDP